MRPLRSPFLQRCWLGVLSDSEPRLRDTVNPSLVMSAHRRARFIRKAPRQAGKPDLPVRQLSRLTREMYKLQSASHSKRSSEARQERLESNALRKTWQGGCCLVVRHLTSLCLGGMMMNLAMVRRAASDATPSSRKSACHDVYQDRLKTKQTALASTFA